MLISIDDKAIKIVQDMDKSISVMYNVGKWLDESGKKPSKWWKPENLNRDFLLQYAKTDEFYVVLVNGKKAAAAILQFNQNSQDWKCIDKNELVPALYIHWLCVARQYSGRGLPKVIVDFAEQQAINKGIRFLRVDTNAQEMKLRKIYENLGFDLISIEQEDYRQTAFYQKKVK